MGVENHNAIIATTWSEERVLDLASWIKSLSEREQILFCSTKSWANGYVSFALMPDGSKEGWATSDEGATLREKFLARLKLDDYPDGSSPWSWVEVGFGEFGQKVLRGNNRNRYNEKDYCDP